MIWFRLLPYGLAVLAVAGSLWWVDARAYDRGVSAEQARAAAATAALQSKLNATRAAHRAAVAAAEQAETDVAALVQRLTDEAAADPDAGQCGLSADSLRRIGAVR